MRAGHCFIFFVLLLSAVKGFPQNAIESVDVAQAIVDENAVSAYESAVNILPPGEVNNETSIVEEPVVILNETVVSEVANEGIQSEFSIDQAAVASANEVELPIAVNEAEVVVEEVPEAVNEVSAVPNEVSSPAAVAVVDQVQEESEIFALRALVPSSAPAEPVESQNQVPTPESVPEVVAEVSQPDVVVTNVLSEINESEAVVPPQPKVDVLESESVVASLPTVIAEVFQPEVVTPGVDSPSTNEVSVSSPLTPVPETSSVAPPTEAPISPVSNLTAIVFGNASVVESAPQPHPETDTPVNEIPERAVVTNFPEIEVIIPLVDVSLPAISGRSLDSETVADSSSVPAILAESEGSQVASDIPASDGIDVPREVSPLPSISSKALDVEPDVPLNVSETVSPTTDVPVPASTTSGVPEIGASATLSGSPLPNSVSDVASGIVNSELPSSTVETSTANASTPPSEIESEVPVESVSSTTAAPLPEVLPEAPINVTEDASRSLVPIPEIPSISEISPVVPSESEVTSSTEAPPAVAVEAITTESPVSTSIPCTQVGNFSVPANCRLYKTCSLVGSELILLEGECPQGYAFSPVLRRCSRDISPCGDSEPTCVRSGSIADPNTSSAYYWCAASLLGGFHKYHVQCDTNEVYVSSISRCLPEALQLSSKGSSDSRSDRDIVKAEWKLLKKEIKHQAKEDKVRQKLEAKAKAYAEKLATKHQKKQKGDTKKHDDSDEEDDDEDED